MGMYTCFLLSCKVKREYHSYIQKLVDGEVEWVDLVQDLPFLERFVNLPRHTMIPFGGMTAYNEDKFGEHFVNFERYIGHLSFLCDLKNYSDEIETFIEDVLPHICDKIYICVYWYEEWDEPKVLTEKDILKKEV